MQLRIPWFMQFVHRLVFEKEHQVSKTGSLLFP